MADVNWHGLKEQLDLGRAGAPLSDNDKRDIRTLAALGCAPLQQWSDDAMNEKLHYKKRSKAVQSLLAAGVPMSSLSHHIKGVFQAADEYSAKEHEARARREAHARGVPLAQHLREKLAEYAAPRTWRNKRTGQTIRASRTQMNSRPLEQRSQWTEVG
jgi:hypothetical protein